MTKIQYSKLVWRFGFPRPRPSLAEGWRYLNLFRNSKFGFRASRRAGARFTQPRAGFTIIELMVVIALIALIAAAVLASLSTARAKSRDARRLADVKTLQNALNLYTTNTRIFPNPTAVGGLCLTGSDAISTALINSSALSTIPRDPQHVCGAGPTDAPDGAHPHYQYESVNGATFKLWFLTETGKVPGTDGYPPACASFPCAKYITP